VLGLASAPAHSTVWRWRELGHRRPKSASVFYTARILYVLGLQVTSRCRHARRGGAAEQPNDQSPDAQQFRVSHAATRRPHQIRGDTHSRPRQPRSRTVMAGQGTNKSRARTLPTRDKVASVMATRDSSGRRKQKATPRATINQGKVTKALASPNPHPTNLKKSTPKEVKTETVREWASRYCEERGFDLEFAESNGAEVVDDSGARREGYPPYGGLIFHSYDPFAKPSFSQVALPGSQIRHQHPPIIDGKPRKFSQKKGTQQAPFFAKTINWKSLRGGLIVSESPVSRTRSSKAWHTVGCSYGSGLSRRR